MTRKHALQEFGQELHISHNQIFTYLSCSLKYRYQYVEGRPVERKSVALPFGTAIHSALEMYYRKLQKPGQPEPVEALVERFTETLILDLDQTKVPVLYKKDTPDKQATVDMGVAMLKAFYEQCTIRPEQIVDVELPLSARLYTDDKQETEFLLVGIIDLLVKDDDSLIVVDNKTAAKPMAQNTADDNHQMTAYSYLLAANQYVFPTADVNCRFDILRKLKKPKLEQVSTVRNADSRKRFAKIAGNVLSAIDAGIYMPQPSWMCADCAYSKACRGWHISGRG